MICTLHLSFGLFIALVLFLQLSLLMLSGGCQIRGNVPIPLTISYCGLDRARNGEEY